MRYKLILADGTELDNLTMNGNTLVSETEITNDVFSEDAMETVKLIVIDEQGNEHEIVYRYAQTNGAYHKENGWNFTIWGASPLEIEIKELRSENEMLEEALVELAEIIGGGE